MFGPGTPCRCAECVSIPKECELGGGLYAGLLLFYLQEIAINKLIYKCHHKAKHIALP